VRHLSRRRLASTAAAAAAVLAAVPALAGATSVRPSHRFDGVRFASVTHGPRAIVGTLGIGVDIVGIVRDTRGAIVFRQHVVPRGPGIAFGPLSAADRASLTRALTRYLRATPHANRLWRTLLTDLRK
jgi:hypothetical protein